MSSPSVPIIDFGSNFVREATSMGLRVSANNTFLTFDAENAKGGRDCSSTGNSSRMKRRFTTNAVLSKDILNEFRMINGINEASDDISTVCEANRDGFTTVMIRNIPNRFSQDELIWFIQKCGFRFDFFYCPIDPKTKCNIGYFFINLTTCEVANEFMSKFDGYQIPAYQSRKVCEARWARIQGYVRNSQHYMHSPVMKLSKQFRPRVFDSVGNECMISGASNEAATRKLFVGGLSPITTQETIRNHLAKFGEIQDVSIILDSATKTSRGFAFVTFSNPLSVQECVRNTNSHFIDGRSLGIRPYTH